MLKGIEEQFWNLLDERELLRQQIEAKHHEHKSNYSPSRAIDDIQRENDAMRSAMAECFDLLVQEVRGPHVMSSKKLVEAFLAHAVQSPSGHFGGDEVTALRVELVRLREDKQQLLQELERTELSRQQALDDARRLRDEVERLRSGVDLRVGVAPVATRTSDLPSESVGLSLLAEEASRIRADIQRRALKVLPK